jgi:RHS repeat-associated protein
VHEHQYHSANWHLLETRQTATAAAPAEDLTAKCQFIWSPRQVDAPILRDDATSAVLYPRLYYLTDGNMNVTALAGAFGGTIEHYTYDPYGKVTPSSGALSQFNNPLGYTGREVDLETRFYCYRARYYQADMGRFVGRDPIGYDSGDTNLYRYVRGNPLNATDPSGNRPSPSVPILLCCNAPAEADSWVCTSPPDYCGFLNWANGTCCTASQIEDARGHCEGHGYDLCDCAKWNPTSKGMHFCCKKLKKGRWHCSAKPRGTCPAGCDAPFRADGDSRREAYDAAWNACVAAGCNVPPCGCGHVTCREGK